MRHLRLVLGCCAVSAVSAAATAQAAWQRLYLSPTPPATAAPLLGCIESTDDLVALFGTNPSVSAMRCWTYSWRFGWTAFTGATPPPRNGAVMAYDAARERLVLFGGEWAGATNDEHWEFFNSGWVQRNLASRPPGRHQAAMAFDRSRGVMVLCGGESLPIGTMFPSLPNDLWEFDGSAWTQRTMPLPPPRRGAHLAFDPARNGMVLFGGILATTNAPTQPISFDTWAYDGTAWTMRTPATPPSGGAMVTDLHRARVLMPFGQGSPFAWEWDGSEWQLRLQASPAYRTGAGLAYQPDARRVVMWGGLLGGLPTNEMWQFATAAPADLRRYGTGCTGSSGVPQLDGLPYQLPWLGDLTTVRLRNLGASVSAVVFATGLQAASVSLTPFGMPGCTQLLVPVSTEFQVAAGGSANWSLQAPNTAALAGVEFRLQGFALDASANAAGVSVSNGLHFVLGSR